MMLNGQYNLNMKKKRSLQTYKMLNIIQLMDDEGLGHCKEW